MRVCAKLCAILVGICLVAGAAYAQYPTVALQPVPLPSYVGGTPDMQVANVLLQYVYNNNGTGQVSGAFSCDSGCAGKDIFGSLLTSPTSPRGIPIALPESTVFSIVANLNNYTSGANSEATSFNPAGSYLRVWDFAHPTALDYLYASLTDFGPNSSTPGSDFTYKFRWTSGSLLPYYWAGAGNLTSIYQGTPSSGPLFGTQDWMMSSGGYGDIGGVPEPSTVLLTLSGLAALPALRRRLRVGG